MASFLGSALDAVSWDSNRALVASDDSVSATAVDAGGAGLLTPVPFFTTHVSSALREIPRSVTMLCLVASGVDS